MLRLKTAEEPVKPWSCGVLGRGREDGKGGLVWWIGYTGDERNQ